MRAPLHLTPSDIGWPTPLNELDPSDQPSVLYWEGDLLDPDNHCVAIVGSRRPTHSGIRAAQLFADALAHRAVVVVSGLALGIDGAAHEAALSAGGKTIAVVGSGLDRSVLYPKRHLTLADRIISSGGALVSEYDPLQKPAQWTFPRRNRIIAGICSAVIVVEASEKSGALITARSALEYNRDVAAVPGNIFSDLSRGTNALISRGATPLCTVEDMWTFLDFAMPESSIPESSRADTHNDEGLLQYFDGERTVEDILDMTGLAHSDVLAQISAHEIQGRLVRVSGTVYQRRQP